MIREAHVGVGVKGAEGYMACAAADYGISQFRFLTPLILKHGQRNYVRISNLICYMFYKNILLSMSLFWFNFNNAYSGQKYFTEGAVQMYNTFYTSFPIIAFAVYDSHISADMAYRYPELYRSCLQNAFFSTRVFWGWLFDAFTESLILSIIPLYTVSDTGTFLEASAICMLGIVIVANLKLFAFQSRWHLANVLLIAASIGFLIASFFAIGKNAYFDFDFYGLFGHLLFNTSAWLTMLLMLTAILGKDAYLAALERIFNFRPFHIAQEIDAGYSKEATNSAIVAPDTFKPVSTVDVESPSGRSVRTSFVSASSPSAKIIDSNSPSSSSKSTKTPSPSLKVQPLQLDSSVSFKRLALEPRAPDSESKSNGGSSLALRMPEPAE